MDSASSKICIICQKSEDFPLFYGDFLKRKNISVHYFCLLFSYGLQQNGKDKAGFLGFQIHDIKKYVKKIQHVNCLYCNEPNAAVKCFECKTDFHLICGIKQKCHLKFIDDFKSYCHQHIKIYHEITHSDNELCIICLQIMGPYHPILSIAPRCCDGNWFHRSCLLRYALSAGYYVKCFWCQSKEFREQIREEGIFVPDREATWESQRNAYRDLHRPYRKCSAKVCICPKGNEYFAKNGIWSTMLCCMCGTYALHTGCFQSTSREQYEDLICDDCRFIKTSRSILEEQNNSPDRCSATEDGMNYMPSDLDKTLFLAKTLHQESEEIDLVNQFLDKCENNDDDDSDVIFEEKKVENAIEISDDSTQITDESEGESDKENDLNDGNTSAPCKLRTFCFEHNNLKGYVKGYVREDERYKWDYTLDDIIPVMAKINVMTDSEDEIENESDVEFDSEDDEIVDIFLETVEEEFKKDGKSDSEIETIKKSLVSEIESMCKKKTKDKQNEKTDTNIHTFLVKNEKNNSTLMVKGKLLGADNADKEEIDLDDIKILQMLLYEDPAILEEQENANEVNQGLITKVKSEPQSASQLFNEICQSNEL